MLKNYLKIAFRNLLRNKVYSFINIGGLTLGMTCFCLIALYIQYEMSYDSQHKKAKQIYRVAQQQKGNTFRGTDLFTGTPAPLTPILKREFPEVASATTLQIQEMLLTKDKKVFYEKGLFSDEYIFDVFTFPIIEGEGKEALKKPNSIILTKSLAQKYFGNENPIGKTLLFDNKNLLTVKGIIADIPVNQHFTFKYITSFKNLPYYKDSENNWGSNNFLTYVVLPRNYDYKQFEGKLSVLDKHLGMYKGLPFKPKFFLQPLLDIHLFSHINFEKDPNGDIRYIYLFASIALIILGLASINYTNLTIAQSARRAKEVGMRKVIGAIRIQLIYQFLCESFLLTVISFLLALILTEPLLPILNQITGQNIPFNFIGNYWLLSGMFLFAIFIGSLSGVYPALYLSAISPTKALKGNFLKNHKKGGINLRNILLVSQFAASMVLAIGSIVIYNQLQYIQNKKLGYNRERIIFLPYNNTDISSKTAVIRAELLKNPQIEKVSFANYLPLDMFSENLINKWDNKNHPEGFPVYSNFVDYDFLDLFEIKLSEGRNFAKDFPTDSSKSYILNESAVKALGWKSAIGKQFNDGYVIGVMKDFHFQTFNLAIKPMYLRFRQSDYTDFDNIIIKTKLTDTENTLAFIEKTAKSILPNSAYQFQFMDVAYNQLYTSEKRFGQAFTIFTVLALFIALMGLLGLVSYNILQRTKEIGIRKVLGASVNQIVTLLSKDFMKLVLIAFIIATPVAYYLMNQWLQNFAYRIELSWWVFALAGIVSLLIAFITISLQAIKSALANPVDSLRTE